jgi:hypothetical protein
MRLTTRAFLWLAVGMLITTLVSVLFLSFDLRRAHRDAAVARLSVSVNDLRRAVEARLAFGQPLALLQDGQTLLEREKANLAGAGAVMIAGPQGHIQQSTDRTSVGDRLPEPWLGRDGNLRDQPWSEAGERGLVVGAPIVDGFGHVIGAVIIRESIAHVDLRAADTLLPVGGAAAILFVLALPAAYFGARVALDPLTRAAARLTDHLIVLRRADIEGAPLPAPAADLDPLAAGFVARAESALAGMAAASAEINRHDGTS